MVDKKRKIPYYSVCSKIYKNKKELIEFAQRIQKVHQITNSVSFIHQKRKLRQATIFRNHLNITSALNYLIAHLKHMDIKFR